MSATTRTASSLAALLIAACVLLVATSTSRANPAPDTSLHTLAAGDFDGVCDDLSDYDDPDCGDYGTDDDPADSGDPIDGELDGVCDEGSAIDDPDCSYEDDSSDEPILWPAPPKGAYAKLSRGSRRASTPKGAPKPIRQMIKAANSLVRKPYRWGGGHARWKDRGYDCSGAVSYVLHAGGYLDWALTSGGFMRWGDKGPGNWLRIYASKRHVFIVVAGLRFDTTPYGAGGGKGPRWRETVRPTTGFKLRHPRGL